MEISMKRIVEKFEKEYSLLYDAKGYVDGYDEAVTAGDEFIRTHGEFIREFALSRGDILSSDREVAAFMFALQSCE